MKKKVIYLFTVFCIIFANTLTAQQQSIEALKKQRKEIEALIVETTKMLKRTQNDEKQSTNKLTLLKKNLNERKNLINSYNTEINLLDNKIDKLISERTSLEKQLVQLKQEYAKLIQKTQTNRNSYSKLMFLLSAKDFDQTLRRVRYLQEFTNYKKEQARKIELVKQTIQLKSDSLDQHKDAKVTALKAKEKEQANLQKEQKNEQLLLAGHQKTEKQLLEQYDAYKLKRAKIDNKIQQVIEEEIRKAEEKRKIEEARRKAVEEARRKAEEKRLAEVRAEAAKNEKAKQQSTKQTTTAQQQTNTRTTEASKTVVEQPRPKEIPKPRENYGLTREEELFSGGFANNRGRLPWPVDKGYISGHFGIQPHPFLKHVTINNKGTYFSSPVGTNARAVYDGEVVSRFSAYGSGNIVIIRHGNYRTVYGNLSNIFVRVGDRVKAKQEIGEIYTDEETGRAELDFRVYVGSSSVDPESWISR